MTQDDIWNEQEAIANMKEAVAVIASGADYYWRMGDGMGGYVLDLLEKAIREAGHTWPYGLEKEPNPKAKKKIPGSLRTAVFERDMYRCVKCGDHKDLSADHIHPESKGGKATFDNLQTLCRPCNSRKGARV